jgi:N-acetylglucosamine kinase-like BadF-type ATPase
MLRVGIDVGGTNTDAVVMRGPAILGWAKKLSTDNPFQGIREAITDCLEATSIGAVLPSSLWFITLRGPSVDAEHCTSTTSKPFTPWGENHMNFGVFSVWQ